MSKQQIPYCTISLDKGMRDAPKSKQAPRYVAEAKSSRHEFKLVVYALSRPDALKAVTAWRREHAADWGKITMGKLLKIDHVPKSGRLKWVQK